MTYSVQPLFASPCLDRFCYDLRLAKDRASNDHKPCNIRMPCDTLSLGCPAVKHIHHAGLVNAQPSAAIPGRGQRIWWSCIVGLVDARRFLTSAKNDLRFDPNSIAPEYLELNNFKKLIDLSEHIRDA
jgi:hypothetical protein